MPTPPLVSVVMSVYNCQQFLSEAIDSLLNQTFTDFEFIIIDDGSTDDTGAILADYKKRDRRIKVIAHGNKGLIASLNKGCSLAVGKYIARMDADDISLPMRLERQVDYMEGSPSVGILGTWVRLINEQGKPGLPWRTPTAAGAIKWALMFGNCLAHPTVLMRRDVVERLESYNPLAMHVEDYDLWARATGITLLANLPEVLLMRRDWAGSISSKHFSAQETLVHNIMRTMIEALKKQGIATESIAALRQVELGDDRFAQNLGDVNAVAALIRELYATYIGKSALSDRETKEINQDVGRKLYHLALATKKLSTRKSLDFFVQALKLDPRLVFPVVKTGARILAGKPM